MTREEILKKIEATKAEMATAGPVHRRDLYRALQRLTRKLRQLDMRAMSELCGRNA